MGDESTSVNPVQIASSAALFLELCCDYSAVTLRALALLFRHSELVRTPAFVDRLKQLIGHYALLRSSGAPASVDQSGLLTCAHDLMRMDLVRRENAALLLMFPVLLDNALWRDVLATLIERNKDSLSDALLQAPEARQGSVAPRHASVRATLESAQALVFQEMLQLVVGADTARLLTGSKVAVGSAPLSDATTARALVSWQEGQQRSWSRWVHMGVRRQPRAEDADAAKSDGGLSYTRYADLLNIVHSQRIDERPQVADLAPFTRVSPNALKPNSELFLFKKGFFPLWESMLLGANLDHDFNEARDLQSIWSELVVCATTDLFWRPETPQLVGFALVKRWNGAFRLTLWLDRYVAAQGKTIMARLPPSIRERPFRYRANIQRISKHAIEDLREAGT